MKPFSNPNIVLFCGGRNYNDLDSVVQAVDEEQSLGTPFIIVGGADGADRLAKTIAQSRGVHVATVDALWDPYGKSAGPIRNAMMLTLNPVRVRAFPGGNGTANMLHLAHRAGIEVVHRT